MSSKLVKFQGMYILYWVRLGFKTHEKLKEFQTPKNRLKM